MVTVIRKDTDQQNITEGEEYVTPEGIQYVQPPEEVHYVVYDIETKHLGSEFGGLEKVRADGSWRVLGISCVGLWDSETQSNYVYDEHTLSDAAAHIEGSEVSVSFNGTGFDNLVIEALLGRRLRHEHYDILKAIKETGTAWKGNGLGPVCERTIGVGKNGDGLQAPGLLKSGRYAELFNYCLHDVYLTRDLFEHIRREGWVEAASGRVALEVPAWLRRS